MMDRNDAGPVIMRVKACRFHFSFEGGTAQRLNEHCSEKFLILVDMIFYNKINKLYIKRNYFSKNFLNG